ncbi:MAG: MMPL family transporter [Microbacteriaceae bacterium]
MSQLLYRLGQFASRRAWTVIVGWFTILGIAGVLAATSGGVFTTAMTIGGVPAQRTIDKLQSSFPDASRGTGQVIFHTANGVAFTEAEKTAIAQALTRVNGLPAVSETVNPFTAQAKLNDQRDELAQAPDKIAAAQAKIDDGRHKITDGRAKLVTAGKDLEKGIRELAKNEKALKSGEKELLRQETIALATKSHLEGVIAQLIALGDAAPENQLAEAQGGLAQVTAGLEVIAAKKVEIAAGKKKIQAGWWQIEVGRKQITKGEKDLTAAEIKLDDGQKELDAKAADIAPAQTLIDAAKNFRLVSADGSTAIATILFETPISEVEAENRIGVAKELTAIQSDNLRVEVSQELLRSLDSLLGPGELIGLAVAAVTLFVMLGTLIGAGLPVLGALIGVGISGAITFALSAIYEFTSTTPILGVMLGLAVGIDYALFIINRHRSQLKSGISVRDSVALANGTSGNSVVFAGLTVVIALAALNLTGIGFLGVMGTMGAMAIVFAVLIALTLTPALLSRIGMRILSKKERRALAERKDSTSPAETVSTKPVFATRRPWVTLVATVSLLAIASIPFGSMRLGLPDGKSEPLDSAGYKSYKLTSEAFGEGVNGALIVVAEAPRAISEDDEVDFQATVVDKLMSVDNVDVALPAGISSDRTSVVFRVIPAEGPNSVSTAQVVTDVRALDAEILADTGAHVEVTGLAAINIDVSNKLGEALPLYLITVIGLSLLLMMLVFRSIAVPVIASLGFLLTVFATLGATVAVFQWGWLSQLFDIHDPAPILSFLPTILIGILFGLAMDYQLFLASGMREAYVHGKSARDSVNFGIHLSRSVVIAAAIIMISVFGGFIFSHTMMIRPVGFGLAAGVLIDAFVVRLMLVPAALTLLGDKAWWLPKWLDRILPDVDVEGAKLEGKLAH